MKFFSFVFKLTLYTFIFLGISNSSYSKALNFNQDAKNISNYFSGMISFNNFDYFSSEKFFNNLNESGRNNQNFSSRYIQSLINLEKYNEAYSYSKKLEKKNSSNFESNLIQGLFQFKNKNYSKAKIYFDRLNPSFEHRLTFEPLQNSLKNWSEISASNKRENIDLIKSMSDKYGRFKNVQEAFAHCYFDTSDVEKKFNEIINNEKNNFYRYNFFFANYLIRKGEHKKAENIISLTSKNFPRNLLINQFKETLEKKEKNKNEFNCKESDGILAEIFYAFANALSTQRHYQLSNFYINLSKYLNPNFLSYNGLLAENFANLKKYDEAKKTYKKLYPLGSYYRWNSSKEIASILDAQDKKVESINFLSKSYKEIDKDIYRTFDLANFLRGDDSYEESIKLYSEILSKITRDHKLYPRVLDRRGTAYERIGKWELGEKDLMQSLEILPDQAYTINYLAYTWIEKEKNTRKALTMLKKANTLKENDGYITDSLGWALYKLNNFPEAQVYLQHAITLMPEDPIVNDHFADCLWMNNKKIQARYYWKYVLTLEDTKKELRQKIENKLLFGVEKS
tara:strand:- start:478 stop:2181 length:1704 start_codon:yes stop_codon:yes gene_type:complete